MSFFSRETSVDSGKPIELYQIVSGLQRFYATTSRKSVLYQTQVYEPWAMKRSAIEVSREYNKNQITITVPSNNALALQIMRNPPETLVTLTILRYHEGDNEYATFWTGRITGVKIRSQEAEISAEQVYTALRAQGRRKTYSTQCAWTLYKIGCGVNQDAYRSTGTITAVSGTQIGSAAFGMQPDGFFVGGKMEVEIDGEIVYRRIDGHVGAQVIINAPIPALVSGLTVNAYPGCNHTYQQCMERFNNSINYGGFPWKPLKDPFSGASIY